VTAALFVEAVDTAVRLFYAGAAWAVLTAAVATLALYAVTAIAWGICHTVWNPVRRRPASPSWSRGRAQARRFARTRTRRPHWAPNQPIEPIDYEEAA
jgi:hypothetical protein